MNAVAEARTIRVPSKDNIYKWIILVLFSYILYQIRVPLGLVSDDAVVAALVETQTLLENFQIRWQYNGRIITDIVANVFYRYPLGVWKTFDTVVYVLMALLISKIFTKDQWNDLLVVCALILLFPMSYLSSAGYIASTTNYIYPITGLLVIMRHLLFVRDKIPVPTVYYPATVLSILYVTNHDQSAMVLLGGAGLYLIYSIVTKADKAIVRSAAVMLAVSATCYLFMFLTPGHRYRMMDTNEMEFWLPQYADWSFAKKIYHGFSTTVANLLFTDVKLFSLFSVMLLILALSQDSVYKKVIGAIPFSVMLMARYIGIEKFVVYFDYTYGMPELVLPSENICPLILSVISVCSIFFVVCTCVEKQENKWLLLMLLVLASGSREMMGLSATIYASSFRTFTFFLWSLMACCLILLREMKSKENNWMWYLSIGAIMSMLLL